MKHITNKKHLKGMAGVLIRRGIASSKTSANSMLFLISVIFFLASGLIVVSAQQYAKPVKESVLKFQNVVQARAVEN